MSRDSRTIFRFVAVGFVAFGAALVSLMASPGRNWLAVVAACLCPTLLLIARDFYIVEQLTWGSLALVLLFVMVTNCLVYGLIGIIYVLLRRRFDGREANQKVTI